MSLAASDRVVEALAHGGIDRHALEERTGLNGELFDLLAKLRKGGYVAVHLTGLVELTAAGKLELLRRRELRELEQQRLMDEAAADPRLAYDAPLQKRAPVELEESKSANLPNSSAAASYLGRGCVKPGWADGVRGR